MCSGSGTPPERILCPAGLSHGNQNANGLFILTGAVHLIGVEAYTKLIRDHNSFLDSITTVPVGDFQQETLNIPFSTDSDNDIAQTNLYESILEQPWCISVERTNTPNKVLVMTMKGQLATACAWVDIKLPELYNQHVAGKLDVTTMKNLIPRRLDKPILTTAGMTYADKLKQRTSFASFASAATQQPAQLNRPPCSHTQKPAGLTFDEQPTTNNSQSTPEQTAPTMTQTLSQPTTATTAPFDYMAELNHISMEIKMNLKAKFEAAIANIQKTVDSIKNKVKQHLKHYMEHLTPPANKVTQD